jgi:hypothetical protein
MTEYLKQAGKKPLGLSRILSYERTSNSVFGHIECILQRKIQPVNMETPKVL